MICQCGVADKSGPVQRQPRVLYYVTVDVCVFDIFIKLRGTVMWRMCSYWGEHDFICQLRGSYPSIRFENEPRTRNMHEVRNWAISPMKTMR